jgi:hypothetical protein
MRRRRRHSSDYNHQELHILRKQLQDLMGRMANSRLRLRPEEEEDVEEELKKLDRAKERYTRIENVLTERLLIAECGTEILRLQMDLSHTRRKTNNWVIGRGAKRRITEEMLCIRMAMESSHRIADEKQQALETQRNALQRQLALELAQRERAVEASVASQLASKELRLQQQADDLTLKHESELAAQRRKDEERRAQFLEKTEESLSLAPDIIRRRVSGDWSHVVHAIRSDVTTAQATTQQLRKRAVLLEKQCAGATRQLLDLERSERTPAVSSPSPVSEFNNLRNQVRSQLAELNVTKDEDTIEFLSTAVLTATKGTHTAAPLEAHFANELALRESEESVARHWREVRLAEKHFKDSHHGFERLVHARASYKAVLKSHKLRVSSSF